MTLIYVMSIKTVVLSEGGTARKIKNILLLNIALSTTYDISSGGGRGRTMKLTVTFSSIECERRARKYRPYLSHFGYNITRFRAVRFIE